MPGAERKRLAFFVVLLYLGAMKNYQRQLLVAGLYALIAFITAWPVIASLTTHVAGQGGDPYQTLWRFEEKPRSFNWQTEFLGQGEPRLVNLTVWPWMWVHGLFGEPISYNLIWLLSFILAGYGMYLLAGELFKKYGGAAWLTGLMYMLLPFHMAHSFGHFGAMQVQWIPLIIWAFLRWFKSNDLRWGALTGLLIVIQAWSEHHYLLWLAFFGLVALFYWRTWSKQWLGVAVVTGLLIILPYWPTVRLAWQPGNSLELGEEQTIRFSADALSYITPASFHSLWGERIQTLLGWRWRENITEATYFVGWIPLLLILFFHQRIPARHFKFWVTVGVVFLLISLGPVLHVGGWLTGLPLPYTLIGWWPGLASVRAVGRAGIFVMVAMSILFGWVWHTQARPPIRRAGWPPLTVIISGLLLLEFLFLPLPMQSAQPSPAYDFVRTRPGKAVIELPAATNYTAASRALLASTIHDKEVIASIALERGEDPETQAEIKALPGVKQLLYLRTTDLQQNRQEFFGQDIAETLPDALRWLGVAAIIVHADSLTSLQLEAIKNLLERKLGWLAKPFGDVTVYVVPAAAGSDGIVIRRGEGWETVTYDRAKKLTLAAYRGRAEVVLINTTTRAKQVVLSYNAVRESEHALLKRQSVTVEASPGETVYAFTADSKRTVIANPTYAITDN